MGAEEAKSLGLVYKVCPREELKEQTEALARQLSSGPLVAYANLKKQFFDANFRDYERYLTEGEVPTRVPAFPLRTLKKASAHS